MPSRLQLPDLWRVLVDVAGDERELMITFASLFLGLWYGIVTVECVAARDVASVQLLLDGRPVATLSAAPWKAEVDLGTALAPRELVAVARDARGQEIGRARQWINRPRPQAEASFVLEPGKGGTGRVARLVCQSATREEPTSVVVTFDGRRLATADPARIEIPPFAPDRLHFLHAEVDFPGNLSAVVDATLGQGARNEEALTNLTAVPILLAPRAKAPEVAALHGAFQTGGTPVKVVAVEDGPAEVAMVVTDAAAVELDRLRRLPWGRHLFPSSFLHPDERVRLVRASPRARSSRSGWLNEFLMSQEFGTGEARPDLLAVAASAGTWPPSAVAPRLGDAIGLAALTASARDRRRAVVLVLGAEVSDESPLAPGAVLAYLSRLRVPLLVWRVSQKETAVTRRWGPARDATTPALFDHAVVALRELLERQRIVWLEGTHPRDRIAAAGDGTWRLLH